ncbi:hypothetical protein ACQ4PT_038607 [Festuca glaucescens]
MQTDFAPENSSPMMDLANKYGVTPGTLDYVSLGPGRIVKVPPPPVPIAGATCHCRVNPSPLESELLDTLHRHYLQALAMMDREMVSSHARGMVLAGYAYGLHDPVCNIVANCVWYDTVLPASSSQEELQPMSLSCKAIFRLARRSLDALVAFIRTYAPSLSDEGAMSYLNRSNGNLHHAAMLVDREGVSHTKSMRGAFRAAIQAAHLPSYAARLAQFWFIFNCAPTDAFLAKHGICGHPLAFGLSDLRWPQSKLSIFVPDFLKSGVSSLGRELPIIPSSSLLSRGAYRALRIKMHGYKMDQEFCLNIVNMALEKLFTQFREPYQVHLLCGQTLLTLPSGSYYHVNFLASREGEPTQLFFAEVRASLKGVDDVTLCCPVTLSGRTGGCFSCEFKGMKLIHPVDEEFNGQRDHIKDRNPKLVKLFKKDPTTGLNVPLIDDYIFFEPHQHPEVTTFLETNYSSMSDDQVDLSLLWFENYLP